MVRAHHKHVALAVRDSVGTLITAALLTLIWWVTHAPEQCKAWQVLTRQVANSIMV
jgi:hypothetical protein